MSSFPHAQQGRHSHATLTVLTCQTTPSMSSHSGYCRRWSMVANSGQPCGMVFERTNAAKTCVASCGALSSQYFQNLPAGGAAPQLPIQGQSINGGGGKALPAAPPLPVWDTLPRHCPQAPGLGCCRFCICVSSLHGVPMLEGLHPVAASLKQAW
jgi:hypothetical protein